MAPAIQPRDSNKPSLGGLGHDILDLIAERLHDIDPPSVNALALVCSALHHKARYVQLRDVSLDFWSLGDAASQRVSFLARNAPLSAVRTLRVRPPYGLESSASGLKKAELASWTQLGGLVPLMAGLRDLHWGSTVFPDCVLAYLGKNPQVRLHLSFRVDVSAGHEKAIAVLRALPARLARTQGISSLRIKLFYTQGLKLRELVQDALRPLLVSSPRLRTLSVDMGLPNWGCVIHSPSRDYCGFGLSNNETFPPLEELEIINYPWGRAMWEPGIGVNGYPGPPGTEMEHWASLLDWSSLRRLRLHGSSVHLAEHLAPQLTALEAIEYVSYNPYIDNRIHPLSINLPHTLASIAFAPFPPNGVALISAHAATLRTLSILGSLVADTDLALLRDRLHQLDTLTLLCDRDPEGDWRYAALAIVAGFPSLGALTLWFPLQETPPHVTVATPAHFSAYLRGRGAARLRSLRLHSGLPQKPRFGLVVPRYRNWPPRGEGGLDSEFACSWSGAGGDVDERALLDATRCAVLDWEENERLRRVARGEQMTAREARTLRFVVALRGPMASPDEWAAWRESGWLEWNRAAAERRREEVEGVGC